MEVMAMDVIVESDMSYMGDMGYMEGMDGMEFMDGMPGETQQASTIDKLMSSPVFVGGVAAGVLVIGVLLGLLSAKRRIKKGIDLYED